MVYIKELNDFQRALLLSDKQVDRITDVIEKAYNQVWHKEGPNVDQINALVAPHLYTPEEAFFAAQVILSDVFAAMTGKD